MSFTQSLTQWVQEQYLLSGMNAAGVFIGKGPFKSHLIRQYAGPKKPKNWKQEIRRLVNAIISEAYLERSSSSPETRPQTSLVPALVVADPIEMVDTAPPAPGSDNGRMTRTTPTNAGLNVNYDSRINTQSDPPSATGEALYIKGYQTNNIQNIPYALRDTSSVVRPQLSSRIQELKHDVEGIPCPEIGGQSGGVQGSGVPLIENQFRLLGLEDHSESSCMENFASSDVRDAIIFSTEVLRQHGSGLLPQYALLGSVCHDNKIDPTAALDPRLFLNTNIPFSAFICGLQGSGKSHTMSCVLENSLIKNPILGSLQRPLSALIFHFGQYTSRLSFRPCEAAFLSYPHPHFRDCQGVSSVNILVAPSNYHSLSTSYSQIPGVRVRPFKLQSKDLNISSMLALMSVDQTQATPLYMGQIIRILRGIAAMSAEDFNYNAFKAALESCHFSKMQRNPLQQRLELLESFLDLGDSAADHKFEAGSITIIDLSCPFVDANTACVLFNIYMGIYLESDPTVGKMIVIDEAHKYIMDTPASKVFTESLLTIIRQQRHYGVRVIISTQEPTISPRLMDLCSVFIIHRFSSPEWFDVIRKHVSITDKDKCNLESLFGRIINLRVGEAVLFAPSAILSKRSDGQDLLFQLSSGLLKIKIRKRVTWDGGKTVVCL